MLSSWAFFLIGGMLVLVLQVDASRGRPYLVPQKSLALDLREPHLLRALRGVSRRIISALHFGIGRRACAERTVLLP